ncbi:bifunctional [glutamine synthetase] adenylyltransferase/[glutamine synthetase]-adenylyl-L-tyrosine phosphorylase [Rhizorhapis suberifaciens]|nr:bifunctional [glutamine synthetase] adenylyltransferase/[glutamine synthetase]-adenylyl-L-tyrosine phosphorylase [Rhizorhapis suberifaciens]
MRLHDSTKFPIMLNFSDALNRARRHSGFLSRLADQHEAISDLLNVGKLDEAFRKAEQSGQDASGTAQMLRRRRNALALVTAIADLAGAWDLERVMHVLSDFADEALEAAIHTAFAERLPGEEPRGFAVIALGKHGSRELNYSSDIDPILVYDPNTMPRREREEPIEAAQRIGRRVVELLSARDGDGYVFRVDLRLRPSPEATPIVLPVDAAISYYETMALGWEQAAFIRSRAAAGDKTLGTYFLQAIRPFIWRRSLDFGAIDQITDVSRRIRDHYAQGQVFGPGFDLKRGRGGIREVEFFAQAHQLIHGGRHSELRAPATGEALAALRGGGIIESDVAADLDAAYVLYRTIEHRLQMVEDRQTHSLPKSAEELQRVAGLHGLERPEELFDLLRPHVERTGRIFDGLIGSDAGDGLSMNETRLTEQLAGLGFADPKTPAARIISWRSGTLRALRSKAALSALEAVLPDLMAAIAKAPDPPGSLNRLDHMIARLPSAINFFKLLEARPALAAMLGNILSHAPVLAEALARRTELLDGLIDATAFDPQSPVDELVRLFSALEPGEDYQVLLDRVRQKVGDRRFALGVQIIEGARDPLEVAADYSKIAEAALLTLAEATVGEFEAQHGKVPGSELAILALGRLGGGALTHASDLDLIYLFSGDFRAESDGRRPLGATQYYNRLVQRISNALSVQTASGPLYEVDTRLRPSGAQGLLAVSFDSFERYQKESAWTWEHLALTRARPVFGSASARTALQTIIDDVLHMKRDLSRFVRDAIKMRTDIARHKPPSGPLDAKLVAGGLIDLEFLVHVTQFRNDSGFSPCLNEALQMLVGEGHLPAELISAHDLLTRFLVVSRLAISGALEPDGASKMLVARACGCKSWDDWLESYARARQCVQSQWKAIVLQHGDI